MRFRRFCACASHFNPILHTTWLDNPWLRKVILQNIFFVKNPVFANLPKILLRIKKNLSQTQKQFSFIAISVLKKVNLIVWQNWYKYQVYLYGSEAITCLTAIRWIVTDSALWVIRLPPPPSKSRPPPFVWQQNLHPYWRVMVKLPYLC